MRVCESSRVKRGGAGVCFLCTSVWTLCVGVGVEGEGGVGDGWGRKGVCGSFQH